MKLLCVNKWIYSTLLIGHIRLCNGLENIIIFYSRFESKLIKYTIERNIRVLVLTAQ